MGCVWNVDNADFFPLPLTQVDVVTGKDIVGGADQHESTHENRFSCAQTLRGNIGFCVGT